jgi:hypothetical protein
MSSVGVDLHHVVLPVLVIDGLGSLIKSPLGMYSMSWSPSSQVDPMVSVHSDNSLHRHSRSDIEWSVDMESLFCILSLGSNLTVLSNKDNLPFLVDLTIVLGNTSWLSFNVLSLLCDFKNLVVLDVDKLVLCKSEDLPPL